jgi:hypothetical protein
MHRVRYHSNAMRKHPQGVEARGATGDGGVEWELGDGAKRVTQRGVQS